MLATILRRIPKRTLGVLTLGLTLAFAGGAFAGSKITGAMVQNGSLTGSDVKDHSLTKRDFRGDLRGHRGARGPRGIPGAQGPQGPKGDQGTPRTVQIVRETSGLVTIPAGQTVRVDARCAGQVTGGGYEVATGSPRVIDENDAYSQEGWFVRFDNTGSQDDAMVNVFAYCLIVS